MKRILIIGIIFFAAGVSLAQQNVSYTQFMLNDYGLNPAVAGTGKGWMFMVGRRVQWRDFDQAPETNFATVSKDFGKKGYRRYWHGVGASIEQDKFGMFTNKTASVSYAIHLKLSAKYHLSFGLAAGVKQAALSNSVFDANDPAIVNSSKAVIVFPDLVPGIYLYSKKLVVGVAVRNLYKNKLKQGSHEIGTPSILVPQSYITIGRKFVSNGYDFAIVPSLLIQSSFISLPLVNFNCMAYYHKRVGVGVTYRIHDAVCAMLQVRVFSNLVIGFSYDYTISKFSSAKANSNEFMMGFTPVMSRENYDRPTGAANCPKFEL
jgi:type IX secretion system PorP/SprF family membrane protein